MCGKESFGFPVPRPLGFPEDLGISGLQRTGLSQEASFYSVARKLGRVWTLGNTASSPCPTLSCPSLNFVPCNSEDKVVTCPEMVTSVV